MKVKKYTIEDAMDYYKYNVSKHKGVSCIVCNENTGHFGYINKGVMVPHGFYIVGYIKEFEDYAKMQKLNSINKEAVKPISSDEPKGFVCSAMNKALKSATKGANEIIGYGALDNAISELSKNTNKEVVKPVYTQEMADNGELPPVGSKVALRYNFDSKTTTHAGEVLFASEHYCILWTNFGECCYKIGGYIYEAIDTRKDEEKLVDEVAKQLHQSYINTTDIVKCDDYFKSDARWLLTKFDITLK